MFNREQREHMDYLASIPAVDRCWCGWGHAGRCDTPFPCPADATLADRLATEAPCCGRPAGRPDESRTSGSHYAGCRPSSRADELTRCDLGGEA